MLFSGTFYRRIISSTTISLRSNLIHCLKSTSILSNQCLNYSSIPLPERKSPVHNISAAVTTAPPLKRLVDRRHLRPSQIVAELDKYIIGQEEAKKAVAIALRNRWRRQRVSNELRNEISPRNILMIGPTGCGKTEIARRLAKLSQAPFVKVEATKFTEVGFHGRDVDTIIRDLVENAINLVKQKKKEKLKVEVIEIVEQKILDALVGPNAEEKTREKFLKFLRENELEEKIIEVQVPIEQNTPSSGAAGVPVAQLGAVSFTGSIVDVTEALNKFSRGAGIAGKSEPKTEKRSMTIAEARPILEELELENAVESTGGDVVKEAIEQAQMNGIVFIDEIDKICGHRDSHAADASDEGVQRDLLPLIEGTTVNTKYGNVNTEHILFICSGAFISCKPSELMAELQGRLSIRVELKALKQYDLYRILTEPIPNLIRQQIELLNAEGIRLVFNDEAIEEISCIAAEMNQTVENIGSRRLHTIIEKVMEDISYEAGDMEEGNEIRITRQFVKNKVGNLLNKSDLSRFIL